MKFSKKVEKNLLFIAIAIIVLAFFLITHFSFFFADDYYCRYYVNNNLNGGIFSLIKYLYLQWGGRILAYLCSFLFIGLPNHKIWFDIANTLFFIAFIFLCGRLIRTKDIFNGKIVLLFALLFWFLCPVPCETLFWASGAINYLWATFFPILFLFVYIRNKGKNSSFSTKIFLFTFALISATSEIPCCAICGAFVVFYAFNIKQFKGNVVPLALGFVLGSMVLLFAPGNFIRAELYYENISFIAKLQDLFLHPFYEIAKYKALWLFAVIFLFSFFMQKKATKNWCKNNAFLLITLILSVIAFSFVFRPGERALFFSEILAIILTIKLIDIQWNERKKHIKLISYFLLYFLFIVDAYCAIIEMKKQNISNDIFAKEIVENEGFGYTSQENNSSHRMASFLSCRNLNYNSDYLNYQFGMDSVQIYPYFCREEYWKDALIQPNNIKIVIDKYRNFRSIPLIIRCDEENSQQVLCIKYQANEQRWLWFCKEKLHLKHKTITKTIYLQQPNVLLGKSAFYLTHFDDGHLFEIQNIQISFMN